MKRVIGMPGDVIDIVDDQVYLNGSDTPLDEPYIAEPMNQHETYHFEVPENCYFMMGDNRNYSLDAATGRTTTFPETKWLPRYSSNTSRHQR